MYTATCRKMSTLHLIGIDLNEAPLIPTLPVRFQRDGTLFQTSPSVRWAVRTCAAICSSDDHFCAGTTCADLYAFRYLRLGPRGSEPGCQNPISRITIMSQHHLILMFYAFRSQTIHVVMTLHVNVRSCKNSRSPNQLISPACHKAQAWGPTSSRLCMS